MTRIQILGQYKYYTNTVKILGIHFSLHNEPKTERDYLSTVKNTQKALNAWNTTTLTLEGRILIFRALAISKIVYLSLITTAPNSILNEIQKIQKHFYGTLQNLKLITRHSAIRLKKAV